MQRRGARRVESRASRDEPGERKEERIESVLSGCAPHRFDGSSMRELLRALLASAPVPGGGARSAALVCWACAEVAPPLRACHRASVRAGRWGVLLVRLRCRATLGAQSFGLALCGVSGSQRFRSLFWGSFVVLHIS